MSEQHGSFPPSPEDLHDRIMAAVRAAPAPRRARRMGRVLTIGGGALVSAAILLLAVSAWLGEGIGKSTSEPTLNSANDFVVEDTFLSLWEISAAEVAAFTDAMNGASGEATRTAFSLLDQAGIGLRAFVPTEGQDDGQEGIRGDSGRDASENRTA